MRHAATRSFLAAALLVCAASAQTIAWGPVLPSVAPTDVSTNGGLVYAGNAHNPNVAAISATVNGVTFAGGFHPTNWNGYINGGLNGSTTGDAEYDKLLANSLAMQVAPAANPTGWGGIRLDTLGTLNNGYTYEIQVWFTDQRTGTASNVLYDRVMTMSSAVGTPTFTNGEVNNLGSLLQGPLSGPMDADPDNAPAASSPDTVFGTHCTGTFTYNAASELWLLVQGTHPNPTNVLAPHITALQIRDLSSAYHQNFGAGCHSYLLDTTSVVEAYAGTPAAKTALDGNALLFALAGNGYAAQWLPGVAGAFYVPPTGAATVVAVGDDTTTTFSPSIAPPVPGGTAPQWTVSSNGILMADATGSTAYTATLAAVGSDSRLAWYCWRDYNPTIGGSGQIKTEEVGGVMYVTYDGVYEFGTTNPATFQWQIDLNTGTVTMVWVSMATSSNTTTMIVGASLAGTGPTPVSTPLSSANPILMQPPVSLLPLTLSAAPAPVINPSTLVTYTIGNIPEYVPTSGIYLSTLFLSLNPLPGGFDLAGILTTVPGCKAYIGTLDVNVGTAVTFAPSNPVALTFSTPVFAPGNVIAAQAVALFDGNFPLLNGESGGFLLSNGVISTTQLQ